MKALLFILFLPAFGYAVRPHEYHLAFLELEYNSKATRFEATLKVTAHDLAYITSKKHQKDYSIDQIMKGLPSNLEKITLSTDLFQTPADKEKLSKLKQSGLKIELVGPKI